MDSKNIGCVRPTKKQFGVNQLRCLHPDFDGFGTSAMKKVCESKVNHGRPFGGTGFVYNKMYSKCIKPLLNYSHERVTVLKLCTEYSDILLINAYMPYFNSRDITVYMDMYRETLGYIENILSQNPGSRYIILADFNCNISDDSHAYSKLVRKMMSDYNLMSSFDLINNFDWTSSFTRFDVKTKSYTLIDGILISRDLAPFVDNVRISHYGDNVSDHLPVEFDLHVVVEKSKSLVKQALPFINWSKLTDSNLDLFKQKMTENLDAISCQPMNILQGSLLCVDDSHKVDLENYYGEIVTAVINAEMCLPKTDPSVQRSFWSNDLNTLKRDSIDCTSHWRSMGCPKSGPIFDCKKDCIYKYKTAIRKQKADCKKQKTDDMHSNLLENDSNSFWRKWNTMNKSGSSIASRINGNTDEKDIADAFASHFETVYGNHDSPEHVKLKESFSDVFSTYYADHVTDNLSPFYLSWQDMLTIASKIKVGKANAGIIRPEHFFHGSSGLLGHFLNLFNGMIQHSFVPTDFLRGSISPIEKDSQGDLSDTKNYRGITLGSLPAKLFEFAIQLKTAQFLRTDELQFGFKRKTSSNHALFTLESVVKYFTGNGSNLYVAFLDCTKAFDRVSHYRFHYIF